MPFAATSLQSGRRPHHWLDLPEDDNPWPHKQFIKRRQKQFPMDRARHSEVVTDLLVAVSPSSGVLADAILDDCISPRLLSTARVNPPRVAYSAPATSLRCRGY